MYKISENLKSLMKQGASVDLRIECGNFTFVTNDILELSVKRLIADEGYPLGNAFACIADVTLWDVPSTYILTGQKTVISIIYTLDDGSDESIPLGVFYPEKPIRNGKLLAFTAYDKMYSLSMPYVPNISGNKKAFEIFKDLARQGNFELAESVKGVCSDTFVTVRVTTQEIGDTYELKDIIFDPIDMSLLYGEQADNSGQTQTSAYSINECIGYLAGYVGANAVFDREGKLSLVRFNEIYNSNGTDYTITDDEIQDDVKLDEQDKIIGWLSVNNGESEFISPNEANIKNSYSGIILNNPLILKQTQLDTVFDIAFPATYRAVSLTHLTANPALDCGDVIRYQDEDKNIYVMPIMQQEIIYDGSVVCELTSLANSDAEESKAGEVLKRIFAPVIRQQTSMLSERISEATKSISNAIGGYVSFVDTDGDGIPDNFISGEYPVDLAENSDWRTKGRCIRINKNGIAVSTTGADGPYTDFGVYYDKSLNKYCVNADDIAVGTLQGIKAILDEGTIGGWNVDTNAIYADYGNYRTYIQVPSSSKQWSFSTQTKNEDGTYTGTFFVMANGKVECNNGIYTNTIETNGQLQILQGSTTRFTIVRQNWTLDGSKANRDTITSSGGFVLSANDGANWLYLVGAKIYLSNDTKINGNLDCVNIDAGSTKVNGTLNVTNTATLQSGLKLTGFSNTSTMYVALNSNQEVVLSSSSARYKENISVEIPDDLNPDKLYDLPVKVFNYKPEFKDLEWRKGIQIGLIAEDVAEYYPNACIFNKEGEAESWQERMMIPAMLKLIQEQKIEIDALKERVDRLEKNND